MTSPVHHLIIIRYSPDRPWTAERIDQPSGAIIEKAIRQMDNNLRPIVESNLHDDEEADDIFNIVGGNGRWALFQINGDWQYEDPTGSSADTRLGESDQGYFCKEKNILADIDKVLRIAKLFYETFSYEALKAANFN